MAVVEIAEPLQMPASCVDATLERYEPDTVENMTLELATTNVLRLPLGPEYVRARMYPQSYSL